MILELSSMGFQLLPWWWDWKPLKVGVPSAISQRMSSREVSTTEETLCKALSTVSYT